MATPTLTKVQQKITLSAKKNKEKNKKVVVKNVLATPYANYWPALNPEDNDIITSCLENHLPRVKNEKVKIPWKEIKDIPRTERKQFRENYSKSSETPVVDSEVRLELLFGINHITSGLEKKEVSAVLIASDVQPRFLVKHIIDLAVLRNIPVLVANNLRAVLQKKCGLSSMAIGFKNTIKPDSELSLIYQSIKRVYENYPVPKKHIYYSRRNDPEFIEAMDGNCNVEKIQADPSFSEATNINTGMNKMDMDKREDLAEENKAGKIESKVNENDDNESSDDDVYLYKTSPDAIMFVPRRASGDEDEPPPFEMKTDSHGFIGFSDAIMETKVEPTFKRKQTDTNNSGVDYKSLIVKRLKGDPNRNKRKIEKMKNKKKKKR